MSFSGDRTWQDTKGLPPGLNMKKTDWCGMPSPCGLEDIIRARARQTARECGELFGDLTVRSEMFGDRGVVTVLQDDRYIVSKEFVESDESLNGPLRMTEYAQVILGKARLVVVVPKDRAVDIWLKMLELNRHWLFYYQLFYYDEEGYLHRLDRAAWRRLRGLPPDDGWHPEVA